METGSHDRPDDGMVAPLGRQDLADMLFDGIGEATKPRVGSLVLDVPRRALAWMSRKLDRRDSDVGRQLALEAAEAMLKGSGNGLLWRLSGKRPPEPTGLGGRLDHLLGKDVLTPDEESEVARILDGRGDVIIASELEEDK